MAGDAPQPHDVGEPSLHVTRGRLMSGSQRQEPGAEAQHRRSLKKRIHVCRPPLLAGSTGFCIGCLAHGREGVGMPAEQFGSGWSGGVGGKLVER